MANTLPKHLIKKHHGDMRAAWAEYRAGGNAPSRRRGGSDESVHPTASGTGVRGGRGLVAHIAAHGVVEYDGEAIGAILEGFLAELERPRTVDTTTLYPPHSVDGAEQAAWKALAQERELGRECARRLGVALIAKRVGAASGSRHYGEAIARARQDAGFVAGATGGLASPFAMPR